MRARTVGYPRQAIRVTRAPKTTHPEVMDFGPFSLDLRQRVLRHDGCDVPIGGRAFDLLAELLGNAGVTLSHQDLMRAVWPGLVIEESSLRTQVKAVRRALAVCPPIARLLTNVPRRGYAFLGEVRPVPAHEEPPAPGAAGTPQAQARPADPLIGRSDAVEELRGRLEQAKVVSIVGAGGLGKTTVARAVARTMETRFDLVVHVNLSLATDGARALSLLSTAFHQHDIPNTSLNEIVARMAGRRVLVVLDSCEHVLEGAAGMAGALAAASDGARVLATSREPLGLKGEWVFALPPLPLPDDSVRTLSRAAAFPAIALFLERARPARGGRPFHDSDVVPMTTLCRRLGGLPLSIEFAAARSDALSVHEILARMDSSLELLASDRPRAEERHRSPRAVLAWSHALLDARQQAVFARLAVFSGAFTLEAGAAVAGDEQLAPAAVMATILELARKSLLVCRVEGDVSRFEFVETTRLFALERLHDGAERRRTRLQHAREVLRTLLAAGEDWQAIPPDAWRTCHGAIVDDLYGALDWLWSPEGDEALAVRLTTAGLGLIYSLGLLHHDQAYVARSLAVVRQVGAGAEAELSLIIAALTRGRSVDPQGQPSLVTRALELAAESGNPRAEISARYASWVHAFCLGDYDAAARDIARLGRLTRRHEPAAELMRLRLGAQIHHFRGRSALARKLAEHVLRAPERNLPIGYTGPLPKAIVMRIVLARVLWIQGEVDDAESVVQEALSLASEHPFALTQVLAMAACPIAFWRGDRASAAGNVQRLAELADRLRTAYWSEWLEGYKIALAWIGTDWDAHALTAGSPTWSTIASRRALDEAELCALGRPSAALRLRAGPPHRLWCAAEVMRLEAESLRSRGLPDAGCEALLRAARQRAEAAGELSWQLRAATSLASLLADRGDAAQARRVLQECLDRFRQGSGTRDLRSARALLDRLDACARGAPSRLDTV